MSLSVASRRSAVRTSVSRQRTSVKCTAQMPAAARNLLAAGAAAVLVMGPSASPAMADFASSTFDTQQTLKNSKEQTREAAQNLGGAILDKLNPQGAADKLKEAGESLNLTGAGDKAKSVGQDAKAKLNLSSAGSLGDKAKSAAQDAKSKLNPSAAGSLGDKAKSAANDAASKLNLSSAGGAADKAKSAINDASSKVKSGGNKLPFLTLPSAENFVDKAKSAANDAASKLNPSGPGSVGDKAKSVADDAKSKLNLSSAREGTENLGDSLKNLGKDVQKEAQQRLNPAGLRVPNPGSQDPYDNKFGDAKKNTFGTSGAGKP